MGRKREKRVRERDERGRGEREKKGTSDMEINLCLGIVQHQQGASSASHSERLYDMKGSQSQGTPGHARPWERAHDVQIALHFFATAAFLVLL